MYKYLLLASLCVVGNSSPTLVDIGVSGGGYGGNGGGVGWQGAVGLNGDDGGYGGGGGFGNGGYEGAASSYGTIEHGGGENGGDFHHGVSIVGTGGGDNKGKIFDLTDHGGDKHQGSFGGSFVASAKYSAGGHDGSSGGEFGGYGGSLGGGGFAEKYSHVLGASEQGVGGSHAGYELLPSGSFGGEGLSSYSSGGDIGGGYH